jgi:hypothetical protein
VSGDVPEPYPEPAAEAQRPASSISFRLVLFAGESFRGTIGPLGGRQRRSFSGWVDFMTTVDELRHKDPKDHPSP